MLAQRYHKKMLKFNKNNYKSTKRHMLATFSDVYIYIYIKSKGIYQPENLMSNGSSRHDDAAQTK